MASVRSEADSDVELDDAPDSNTNTPRHWLFRISWRAELVFLAAVLATAALSLTLVGRRAGWPVGQTPPDPMLVQIYAAHIRHGDLFPVWSSSDVFGMGSPVTLYYQKAFFFLGGLIFILLGGSLKATLVLTLGLFMLVGAYGMRKALGVVTDSPLLRTVGAMAFLLSNWMFSDWLIRGDLAEFSALMMIPWLVWWCLTLVKDGRLSLAIVPIMVALVWAHLAIAVASVFLLIITSVAFMVLYQMAGLRSVARRLVFAVGATVLILAPFTLAQLKMGANYDPAQTIIYENGYIGSFLFAASFFLFL